MKTGHEIVERLIDIIGNIYKRPRMYAESACELSSVLFQYHGILDFAEDRYGDSTVAYSKICEEEFGSSNSVPSWWHELVSDPDSPNFQKVIEQWRETDLQLGRPIG